MTIKEMEAQIDRLGLRSQSGKGNLLLAGHRKRLRRMGRSRTTSVQSWRKTANIEATSLCSMATDGVGRRRRMPYGVKVMITM